MAAEMAHAAVIGGILKAKARGRAAPQAFIHSQLSGRTAVSEKKVMPGRVKPASMGRDGDPVAGRPAERRR